MTLMREHAHVMKQVFVRISPDQFDSDCLKNVVDQAHLKEEESATLKWFWKYIESQDNTRNLHSSSKASPCPQAPPYVGEGPSVHCLHMRQRHVLFYFVQFSFT